MKKGSVAVLEPPQPSKEPKLFQATYQHLFRNEHHGITIQFTDRIVTDDRRETVNGFLEIVTWNGNTQAAQDFQSVILNSIYRRKELEAWLNEQIKKQTD